MRPRTVSERPSRQADAIVFASGSAVELSFDGFGEEAAELAARRRLPPSVRSPRPICARAAAVEVVARGRPDAP